MAVRKVGAMPVGRILLPLLLTLAVLGVGTVFDAQGAEAPPMSHLCDELAPKPANEAIAQIPDAGRKLLALRSYVRAGSKLAVRWSWTDEKIKAFHGSDEQLALLAEVAAVSAHFAEANPGYEIYANTKVRSLDVQIRNWNSNVSVGVEAEEILSAWKEKFGTDEEACGSLDPKEVRNWLSGFTGSERARVAAPGLTLHGRAQAIDFQVMRDGVIIAGANSKEIESVWRAEKWDVKLKESMVIAGPSFRGPLVSPDEPWHYDYDPAGRILERDRDGD
jgi:hypothetical protein